MLTDRLISRIKELKSPIVMGLDPREDMIPKFILEEARAKYACPLQAVAEAIYQFNAQLIDAIKGIVPAVKPQIALYEQYGVPGFLTYQKTVAYAKASGLIVIGDVKRGDIASTAQSYSNAHIGRIQAAGSEHEIMKTDFITINPYMGFDSVEPYFADCETYDKGLFVLVKTSNKGSADIQDVKMANGKLLYEHVGGLVSEWGKSYIGESGYSRIGAVVGATHPEELAALRKQMPHTFFLVPGYGAQGGSGKDLKNLWTKNYGAIVNNSRGIIAAYQTEKYKCDEKDFAAAARQAVLDMKADLEAYMP